MRATDHGPERQRVGDMYRGYASDRSVQRRWSSSNLGNLAIRAELVEAVLTVSRRALLDAREILDVGCGTGWWLGTLAERPGLRASLHGVDILSQRIESAQRRVPSATIAVGDARNLPYEGNRFSVVTMFTVLSSLAGTEDAQEAIREAWRVLAPGGLLLIWEPRIANPLNRSTILLSPRDVRAALAEVEAEVEVKRHTLTLLPPLARALGHRTPQLYPWLARLPLLRTHQLMWTTKSGPRGR